MKDWDHVKAIIYNWYPGQIGQLALAEILAGQTNPSGKLPMSIERDFKDSPAYGYIADSTHFMCDDEGFMNMNPEYNRWQYDLSIEDAPSNLYDVHYDEGIFVGYRWYEKKDIAVMFPFGFGLSYTSFEISELKAVESPETIQLSCTVKNTGKVSGAEVVQVYVGKGDSKVERALKELKSFQKIFLTAGEEKELTFVLEQDAFSYYDENSHSWQVEPGVYQVHVGTSVNAITDVVEIKR
jgi:beta-glucosidase